MQVLISAGASLALAAFVALERLPDAERELSIALKSGHAFKDAAAARELLEQIRDNEVVTE